MIADYVFPRACWRCMEDGDIDLEACTECRRKNSETVKVVCRNAKGRLTSGNRVIIEVSGMLLSVPAFMVRNIREEVKSE